MEPSVFMEEKMSSVPASRSTRAQSARRVQTRSKARTAEAAIAYVLTRTILFGAVAVSVFFASSMLGQVKMEQARKEGLRVRMRLANATASTDMLRRRVNELIDPIKLNGFATSRGFVRPLSIAPAPGVQEETLVARNDR
jgi:hypothetical protein